MNTQRDKASDFKNVLEHWQNLKPWFNPVAIRLLMPWFAVIPILLHIFRDVPRYITFPTVPPLVLTMELPFRWWLLWIASLLFAIAFVLFHLLCPKFVKRYASYIDYRKHEHSPRWLASEFAIALPLLGDSGRETLYQRLITKKLVSEIPIDAAIRVGERIVKQDATVVAFDHQGRRYLLEARDSIDDAAAISRFQQEVFWEIFGRVANSRQCVRYVIWALLFLTVVFVGCAICESIWAALRVLLPAAWMSA